MKHFLSIAIIPFLTTACLDFDQLTDKPEEDESTTTTETEETQPEPETDPDKGSDGDETDPDDGSDGEKEEEAKLPELDFSITASNRKAIDRQVQVYIKYSDVMDLFDSSENGFAVVSEEPRTERMTSTREKVTHELSVCDEGLITLAFESEDFNESTGAFEASGQYSAEMIYDECLMQESSDHYNELNGVMSYQMDWSGYSTAENRVENLLITYSFENYTNRQIDGEDTDYTFISGWIDTKSTPLTLITSMNVVLGSSRLDNQYVRLESSADITYNPGDAYPSTGAVSVTGGNDTYAEYTIVPNGVEVSVNGAQPILVTWSDFMADDDGTN